MEDKGYAISGIHGARLQIEGAENGFAGYGFGMIPAGRSGRKETHGPLVPGPWAYAFGLCAVIDNHGGTGADGARGRVEGTCFTVKPGDLLRMADTLTVVVTLDARRYPVLTVVIGTATVTA